LTAALRWRGGCSILTSLADSERSALPEWVSSIERW
jgi:hypothetical protein